MRGYVCLLVLVTLPPTEPYYRNIQYDLDSLRWYDPRTCYITDGPRAPPWNLKGNHTSRSSKLPKYRSSQYNVTSCPVNLLGPTNDSDCGKILLRRSPLPLMIESFNGIIAHAPESWAMTFESNHWNWESPWKQVNQLRLRHMADTIHILWDILMYRQSQGRQGEDVTSRHTWRNLLESPGRTDLESLEGPLWNLTIMYNRQLVNYLPKLKRKTASAISQSSVITNSTGALSADTSQSLQYIKKTVKRLRRLAKAFRASTFRFKSHRDYYRRLKRQVKIRRHIRKRGRKIRKAKGSVEEQLFMCLRRLDRVKSWDSYIAAQSARASKMVYRIRFGDIRSALLDTSKYTSSLYGDSLKARGIVERISPVLRALQVKEYSLGHVIYDDMLIRHMKNAVQSATVNYKALRGLHTRLKELSGDVMMRCAYLDIIRVPMFYEKARTDFGLTRVLEAANTAIRESLHIMNESKQYVALAAFVPGNFPDCPDCSSVERTLMMIHALLNRAETIVQDGVKHEVALPAMAHEEGFLPAYSERIGRHLLFFWNDDETTTTPAPTTTMSTESQASTTTKIPTPKSTQLSTVKTTTGTTTTQTDRPTKKPTAESRATNPSTSTTMKTSNTDGDFYFSSPDGSSTADLGDPTSSAKPRTTTLPPDEDRGEYEDNHGGDDWDIIGSGSGLGSGDVDPTDSPTTRITSTVSTTMKTTPPSTVATTRLPEVDWERMKKIARKASRKLAKENRKILKEGQKYQDTLNGMSDRLQGVLHSHNATRTNIANSMNDLDLSALEYLNRMSSNVHTFSDNVTRRTDVVAQMVSGLIEKKAARLDNYAKSADNMATYLKRSYESVQHEVERIKAASRDVTRTARHMDERAVRANDTIVSIARNMNIIRSQINNARMALSEIQAQIAVTGSETYTLRHSVGTSDFLPNSLNFRLRTYKPDGAVMAIQGPVERHQDRRRSNHLVVGLEKGKLKVYLEPWRHAWGLPSMINDGLWHDIGFYMLDSKIILTDNIVNSSNLIEWKHDALGEAGRQRRIFADRPSFNLKQYFTRNYLIQFGQVPYVTWPYSPDPTFRGCVSDVRVGNYRVPLHETRTSRGHAAPVCLGEVLTCGVSPGYTEPHVPWVPAKVKSPSSPLSHNLSNIYTLNGAGGKFMFSVSFTSGDEGGTVAYMLLTGTMQVALEYRYRRIVVTLMEDDRSAQAVCRTYSPKGSTHRVFAVASRRRVEIYVDCRRCQSLPFAASIARYFPFHKPELIVGPSSGQLDQLLEGRPRARHQIGPFNGVIGRVVLDGIVVYYSHTFSPGCVMPKLRYDERRRLRSPNVGQRSRSQHHGHIGQHSRSQHHGRS